MTLVIDTLPDCGMLSSADGSYFVTTALLSRFHQAGITGYEAHMTPVMFSDDYYRNEPNGLVARDDTPELYYFVITGRCDGPWTRSKHGPCQQCGQYTPTLASRSIIGNGTMLVRQVYANSWHGQDFFYVSEPGLPIITERVAMILAETGNLRRETVQNQELVKRVMPKLAAELEAKGWLQEPCAGLHRAEWV